MLFWSTAWAEGVSKLTAAELEHIANLDFRNLDARGDLPHQSVYAVAQDSTGYIWIATYGGLSRFDGYRLRTYRHDRSRAGSLPDNSVRLLVPGANGDLWIGTDSMGVWHYRAATDSFEALPNIPSEFVHTRMYTLISDGHGGIWAGGQIGLFHFDPQTKSYETFLTARAGTSASALPLRKVFALYLDRDGALWVGGDGGVYRKNDASGFEAVRGLEGEHEVGATPSVWSFLRDSKDRLWVGCDHVGLALYDPAAHVLKGVPGLSGDKSAVMAHAVRRILEHRSGQLWLATYGGGLIAYDTADGFIRTFAKDASPHPLQNNFLRDIMRDRSGVVWLATDNGASTINDSAGGIFQLQPKLSVGAQPVSSEVRTVAMMAGGVWVGFDQGGFGPLGADGVVQAIPAASDVPPAASIRREALAMQQVDATTAFVAGTGAGLFRVDLKSRTYRRIPDAAFDREVVTALCADGDRVWAARSDGLYGYNWRTGEGRLLSHNGSPGSLSNNDVRMVLHARDGRLWVSTSDGLNLLDPATEKFRVFRHSDRDAGSLPANDIRSMVQDRSGRLWLATADAGVAVLTGWSQAGEPVFQTLGQRNGLPSEAVFTLTLGKDGTVWANTGGGLAAIDPQSLAVRIFTAGDGLRVAAQKLFASVTMDDGTLLFRGPEGLILVKPELLARPSLRLPVVMTNLLLAGGGASRPASEGSAIRLDALHRGFEAEFSLLDFASPATTQYSYRLDGFDKDWKKMEAGNRSVIFSDLPAGKFTLHVRASSRSGKGPVAEASFPIDAPEVWNETLTFRLGAFVLAGVFIFLLIRVRTAAMRRRGAGLERQVTVRTSELQDSKRQLEQANLLLQELATRDSLTNLANRRFFLETAEREVLRASRNQKKFCLLLLDIDRFKQINDTHGHLIGDAVIRSVADRILIALRASDLLARFGGEEFIVLLPETDSVPAGQVAERIRAAVEADRMVIDDVSLTTTLSVGCAELQWDETLESLLDRTDQALYRAKRGGRNRVEIA